jgi:hypothetical protein
MTDPKNVLKDQTIQNLISDHEITKETGIYLETDSDVTLTPANTMFSPFINMEFSKNDMLAMIYDNQPGHAWFNTGALRALQSHVEQTGVRIKTCSDFVKTFESLGYEIKQFGNTSSGKKTNTPNNAMLNKLTISTMVPLFIGLAVGWFFGKTVLALVIGGVIGLILGVIISYRVINK